MYIGSLVSYTTNDKQKLTQYRPGSPSKKDNYTANDEQELTQYIKVLWGIGQENHQITWKTTSDKIKLKNGHGNDILTDWSYMYTLAGFLASTLFGVSCSQS